MDSYRVGPNGDLRDVEGRWPTAYGVSDDGAVLVRPDGFIAWRARTATERPLATLRDVMTRVTFRDAIHPLRGYPVSNACGEG
jgi:putative polyketide hydroxylase